MSPGLSLASSSGVQMLDRYQLMGEIAAGGMASVFLARLPGVAGFARFVAIKRLHPHLASERGFVEMFLDEARLAASIHHRNVVPILEIGTSEQGYYLVMEYVEAVTLARLLTEASTQGRPVPRPLLLRMIIDVLSGLHAAHAVTDDDGSSLGVVHRDCSPQNILVGFDGCTRITDFGIARASSRIHNTREGAMKGRLAYMAPEQTQGDDFDHRADLFSVAVLLWEVLAMRRLFKGSSDAETLRRLIDAPIPRLRDVRDDIPSGLDDVCARALSRDPAERYSSAAEMADAIEASVREGASEGVASDRNVATLMTNWYGQELDEQHEAIRNWLTAAGIERRSEMPSPPGPEEQEEIDAQLAQLDDSLRSRVPSEFLSEQAAKVAAERALEEEEPAHSTGPGAAASERPHATVGGKAAQAADDGGPFSSSSWPYGRTSTAGMTAGRSIADPTSGGIVDEGAVSSTPKMWKALAAALVVCAVALVALAIRTTSDSAGPEDLAGAPHATSLAADERPSTPSVSPAPAPAPAPSSAVEAGGGAEPSAGAPSSAALAPGSALSVDTESLPGLPRPTQTAPRPMPGLAAPATSAAPAATVVPAASAAPATSAAAEPAGTDLGEDLTNPYR